MEGADPPRTSGAETDGFGGIENDNLFDVMSEEIEEGRELFAKRVAEDIRKLNIYDRAIIDVLIKSKGHVKSKMW